MKRQRVRANGVKTVSLLLAASLLVNTQGFPVFAQAVSENSISGEVLLQDSVSDDNIQKQQGFPASPVHHCTKMDDGTDYTDWDYVYFGSYPQSEVTDSAVIAAIEKAIAASGILTDSGRDVWIDGTKYRRISKKYTNQDGKFGTGNYRYFKWERIKWKVLEKNEDTLFVVADKALDCKDYHDDGGNITWEDCTLRSWLNEKFYHTAFDGNEQSAIVPQDVVNEDNPQCNTEGGNDTNDKIFLLSIQEATNEAYGFCSDYFTNSVSRRVSASDFAYVRGAMINSSENMDHCEWWLRSPGKSGSYAASSSVDGCLRSRIPGRPVTIPDNGVCPALRIDLSSDFWLETDDGTSGKGGEDGEGSNKPVPVTYLAGILEACTATDFQVIIDGKAYDLEDDFTLNIPETILKNSDRKEVVCTLVDNRIIRMEPLEDIMQAKVTMVPKGAGGSRLLYHNGSYWGCKEAAYSVTCVAGDYPDTLFSDMSGFGIQLSSLQLSVASEAPIILDEANWTERTIEWNKWIPLGDTASIDLEYQTDDSVVLNQINKTYFISGTLMGDGITANSAYAIPVSNMDMQRQKNKEEKENADSSIMTTEVMEKKAQDDLADLCNGMIFSAKAELSEYFSDEQIQEIEKFLFTWMTALTVSRQIDYSGENPDFTEEKLEEVLSHVFSQLGIGKNGSVASKILEVKAKDGEIVQIEFFVDLTCDLDGNIICSWDKIGYDILKGYRSDLTMPCSGFLDMAAADTDAFAESLRLLAESAIKDAYQDIWNKMPEQIATVFTNEVLLKAVDFKYGAVSNRVFRTAAVSGNTTTDDIMKEVTVQGPVDVYIYDMSGNLCGAIVNHVVDESYNRIAMVVEGDLKRIYLTDDSYKIKIVGNDMGTMNYSIKEYDSNMDEMRVIQFEEQSITKGYMYAGVVPEAVYTANSLYALSVEGKEDMVYSDIDTYEDHVTDPVEVEGISLDIAERTLKVGDTLQLKVTVLPADAANKNVIFQSSDESVAFIDSEGKITALKAGVATIRAITRNGNFESTCNITVENSVSEAPKDEGEQKEDEDKEEDKNIEDIKVASLSIAAPSKKLAAGKKVKLTLKVIPENVANKAVIWKTSNKKYAVIDKKGRLVLKKKGAGKSVTITAVAKDGSQKKAAIKIKIMKHAVKSIQLKAPSKTLKAGKTMKIKATVKTTGKKANKALKWKSSNTKYATVNKYGKVKAKKAGKGKTVTISASSTDGTNKVAKVKIKVK